MPDIEAEIQQLRNEFARISAQVIRNQVLLDTLCKSFERHEERQSASNQRVPVLLLGVISAIVTAIGVLANTWIVKGP